MGRGRGEKTAHGLKTGGGRLLRRGRTIEPPFRPSPNPFRPSLNVFRACPLRSHKTFSSKCGQMEAKTVTMKVYSSNMTIAVIMYYSKIITTTDYFRLPQRRGSARGQSFPSPEVRKTSFVPLRRPCTSKKKPWAPKNRPRPC